MSYKVVVSPYFERELKRLAKKYSSIRDDYRTFLHSLLENPTQGNALGKQSFKVRMAIRSKNKGKSGGARVITCVKIINETVYLLKIYDKSEQESITDEELDSLLVQAGLI